MIPKVDGGQKWVKYRRLSNTKRNFSTMIQRSNVDDVFAAHRFFLKVWMKLDFEVCDCFYLIAFISQSMAYNNI
jgi:hypothetical protein